ncbi:12197_t:CDS:10 [Ambispora leptoticha]|uniref:DNA (cytosine-5-)-methyltransferase n=1 Tax=Ambispora leptoticha TaxID=144679 RepID=A0A9N8ZYE2_9GLOM|nr:12197_t:CDS:10 [Ambispora leptoticha]
MSKAIEMEIDPRTNNNNYVELEPMDITFCETTTSRSSEDDAFETEIPIASTSRVATTRSSTRLKRKVDNYSYSVVSSRSKAKKPKAAKKKTKRYEIDPKEVPETSEFELIGEDLVGNDEIPENFEDPLMSDVKPERDESLPCRYLDDFIFYDVRNDNKIINLDAYDNLECELRASGLIEYSQSGQSEIWLRTEFSWYKLVNPSDAYKSCFTPLFKKIRLANLIIQAMAASPDITYGAFLDSLKSPPSSSSNDNNEFELSITFNENDITSEISYICEEINAWMGELETQEEENWKIFDCPLFITLQKILDKKPGSKRSKHSTADTDMRRTKRNVSLKNSNTAVLRHTNPTCVTPFIRDLTKGLFVRKLVTAPQINGVTDNKLEDISDNDHLINIEKETTDKIDWIEKIGAEHGLTYYSSVRIDDEIISVGDIVYVRNDESNEPWFAKVIYMFNDPEEGKMFHSRFFSRGRETILKELAGAHELFLLDQCADNPLASIMKKANVKRVDTSETLSKEERDNLNEKNESNDSYYYRFWYDEERPAFIDARLKEPANDIKNLLDYCYACEHHWAKKLNKKARWISPEDTANGIVYKGVEYHLHDFVYLIPDVSHQASPYEIAQIVEIFDNDATPSGILNYFKKKKIIKRPENDDENDADDQTANIKLTVRHLVRYDDLLESKYSKKSLTNETNSTESSTNAEIYEKKEIKDTRKLVFTSEKTLISVDKLEGVCWVEHSDTIYDFDAYKDERDTFYVKDQMNKPGRKHLDLQEIDKTEIHLCQICLEKRQNHKTELVEFMQFIQNGHTLRAMDIFSGCGGITVGMEKTGVVDTRWAIEFAPSAALTFKKNHPQATTYNQCANLLLERAIAQHNQEELGELEDFQGKLVEAMPAKGEVQFIYCGPPCQGFSGVNRYKKADDIKNSLVATALSYVDFYRPEYFLLENVRGMIAFRLGGEQDGKTKIKGGISMGVVKFILRALTAMGYQARFSVQQAGNHEVPQSRRRLFIWGTKIGHNLPDFPQPSTCFAQRGSISIPLPDGGSFHYNLRTNGFAPHRGITVGEAINDLPEFEYVNPHEVYPATEEEKNEKPKWKQLRVPKVGCVGEAEREYESEPLSEFQRQCRKKAKKLYNHVTRTFLSLNVERIYRVPLIPGADHHDLPERLKPWCLSDPNSAASRHNGWKGLFGRLDFNGHFSTALTDVNPMGKTGTVLHPNQRRILTVRECARAQGFPDDFIFYSDRGDMKDLHRQIGNAVPPPLAFALGEFLVKALFEKYKQERVNIKNKGKQKNY